MNKNQKESSLKLVWIGLSLNLLISCFAIGLYFSKPSKNVVYVDAVKLISKYKGMEEAKKIFDAKKSKFTANLDTLRSEFEQTVAKYDKAKATMSAKEKSISQELIESKRNQYLNYEQIVREQSKKEEQETSVQILRDVNDYIKKYGEQKGFKIIVAATREGNVAYGDTSYDVTDEILQGLNGGYKSKLK